MDAAIGAATNERVNIMRSFQEEMIEAKRNGDVCYRTGQLRNPYPMSENPNAPMMRLRAAWEEGYKAARLRQRKERGLDTDMTGGNYDPADYA
jgi:hypothetical protein